MSHPPSHHDPAAEYGLSPEQQAILRSQAHDWLVRLTSGSATSEDASAYKRWCLQSAAHAAAMSEATRLWELSRQAGHAVVVRQRSVSARGAPLRPGRRAFIGGALAAGAAGWLLVRPPGNLWPALAEMTADYRTATGEQRDLTLDGQVRVALNTQTSVNVLGQRSGIEINAGEAQIDAPAQAASAFMVRAAGGEVSASSQARYNVRVTARQVCVTCLAGVVEVVYGGKRLQALASEQIVYGAGEVARSRAADVEKLSAWRKGVLVFDDVPLAGVIDEINRYRPGKIILANEQLGRRRVQAQVSLGRLADVVGLIRASYGAQVTTLPAGIVVLS